MTTSYTGTDTSGTAWNLNCPTGEFLTGVRVAAGGENLNSVKNIYCSGNRNTVIGSAHGGSGGTVSDLKCAGNSLVNRLLGRSDTGINSIQLGCSDASLTEERGGGGGSSFTLPCPQEGGLFTGIFGEYGGTMLRLGGVCKIQQAGVNGETTNTNTGTGTNNESTPAETKTTTQTSKLATIASSLSGSGTVAGLSVGAWIAIAVSGLVGIGILIFLIKRKTGSNVQSSGGGRKKKRFQLRGGQPLGIHKVII